MSLPDVPVGLASSVVVPLTMGVTVEMVPSGRPLIQGVGAGASVVEDSWRRALLGIAAAWDARRRTRGRREGIMVAVKGRREGKGKRERAWEEMLNRLGGTVPCPG